jgi:hypothetical protein
MSSEFDDNFATESDGLTNHTKRGRKQPGVPINNAYMRFIDHGWINALPGRALRVLAVMHSFGDFGNCETFVMAAKIGTLLGIAERDVQTEMRYMEAIGVITCVGSREYQLVNHRQKSVTIYKDGLVGQRGIIRVWRIYSFFDAHCRPKIEERLNISLDDVETKLMSLTPDAGYDYMRHMVLKEKRRIYKKKVAPLPLPPPRPPVREVFNVGDCVTHLEHGEAVLIERRTQGNAAYWVLKLDSGEVRKCFSAELMTRSARGSHTEVV